MVMSVPCINIRILRILLFQDMGSGGDEEFHHPRAHPRTGNTDP